MSVDVAGVTVRRWHSTIDETVLEGGRPVSGVRRVVVAAVIHNPLAGQWQDDLTVLVDAGAHVGSVLIDRAKALLGDPVRSFGKAGIVGTGGELEHLAAVLHPKFGQPIRAAIGGTAILQSTKKRGAAGVTIDVPLSHIEEMKIRSHFDSVTFCVPDAPFPDEMVICLAVGNGPRAHERVGGLTEEQFRSNS